MNLTTEQCKAVFLQLEGAEINVIRWGQLPAGVNMIGALISKEQPNPNTHVWLISSDWCERLTTKRTSHERELLMDVFDPVTKHPYSIGVMYGMEVLVADRLPPSTIVLAKVENGKVMSHSAAVIQLSEVQ